MLDCSDAVLFVHWFNSIFGRRNKFNTNYTYLLHFDCSIYFAMAANYDSNSGWGMDRWTHDFVADSAMVDLNGLSARHCMVGHPNLSYPHPIHRYQLGLGEEILQWNQKKNDYKPWVYHLIDWEFSETNELSGFQFPEHKHHKARSFLAIRRVICWT